MSDASLFIGAALPWLRNANEDVARQVFNRLDELISSTSTRRELTMRPNTVYDANRRPISAAAEPLSRWDRRPPGVIFREGFRPRVAPVSINDFHQTSEISLHLHRFINDHVRSIFVSTTRPVPRNGANGPVEVWRPPNIDGRYRYEIFAYGGADILATFERQREVMYAEQQEITFFGGIRPGLIRTATEYDERGRVICVWHNVHFNPLLNGAHAPRISELPELPETVNTIRFLDPADHDTDGYQIPDPDHSELRRRREADQADDADESNGNLERYELVADPGASNVLPASHVRRACMLLPSQNDAIFFADTQVVTLQLDTDHNLEDKIAPGGVKNIVDVWPALHEAKFLGVDAVLPNPSNNHEAYFFFREHYILVNITTRQKVFDAKVIANEWPSLRQVGFSTIDAAVLMDDGTAYFFRGKQYVRVEVKPGTNDDTVVGSGPKPIRGNWSVLDQVGFDTVDAILTSPHDGNTYFFSGNDYVRMVIKPATTYDQMTGPRKPVSEGWSSLVQAKFY
ncbi:Hemopexin-like domain-containing protein [Xylariaceae sp. AK1471]|nr:Hemopexin-like domain-containing protein [Xylariaceae sp. AK1471]